MKAMKILSIGIAVLAIFATSSCTVEEGFGGKSTISGKVTYPGGAAEGAIVYIAYGTTEATTVYDHSTVADEDGNFELGGLQKGDYFVDAKLVIVRDEFEQEFNTPGFAVTVGEKKADIALDIELK
jgi:hypothetical protein